MVSDISTPRCRETKPSNLATDLRHKAIFDYAVRRRYTDVKTVVLQAALSKRLLPDSGSPFAINDDERFWVQTNLEPK